MFDLIITTENYKKIMDELPKVFESNIQDLEPVIAEAEAKAKTVVDADSEDDIKWADDAAADLRKKAKRIHQFCKDTLDGWSNPWVDFKDKCQKFEKRLEDAARTLSDASKVGKDKIKALKRQACLELWDKMVDEAFPKCNNAPHFTSFFERMTDPKTTGNWLNKGATDGKIREQMDAEIERCKTAFDTIQTNYGGESNEIKQKAWLSLRVNFDVNEAIVAVNAYKQEQAQLAEAKRLDEEKRQREAAEAADRQAKADEAMQRAKEDLAKKRQESAETKTETPAEDGKGTQENAPKTHVVETQTIQTYRLAVTGTVAALVALRQWGEAHGVTFKNLDNVKK